ncbi:MAG TPA: amidohydrolase family protein [Anaerolineales bacterium]
MTRMFVYLVLLALALSACHFPLQPSPQPPTSTAPHAPPAGAPAVLGAGGVGEIIFHNGVIITMSKDRPTAEAILVSGDKVQAVGSNDEIMALRKVNTEVIDLGGLALMPGFVDAHSHLFGDDLLHGRDIEPSQQMALGYGVTTITEMGPAQDLLDKMKAAADAGKFHMRVNVYLGGTTNCGDPLGDWWKAYKPNAEIAPNLTVRGIKIFTDGGSCKIPAVSMQYPGGGYGDLFFTQDQLNQLVSDIQGAGFQAGIHALGDRAVEEAQNAIAAALNGQPNTYRHRIEHNAVIRPDMLARYSQIGIVPVIFGAYSTCTRTANAGQFKYLIPEQYGRWEWPWRALVDANPGLPIAWHADYGPFHWLNPFYILWGFVTRNEVNTDGSICVAPDWFKEGAIRVDEALPMMTINSAYALFMDKEVGSLEPGKFADLVIASSDPLHTQTEALKDIQVYMTMIGGKVEYCAAGHESLCTTGAPSTSSPAAPAPSVAVSSVTATASAQLSDSPASNALDGDPESIWNSGQDAPQWIMLDLGEPKTIKSFRLNISQYPEGETVHQIWVGAFPDKLKRIYEFSGFTKDPGTLVYTPTSPLNGIQYIKILTTNSPSWVAWREIEIK